MLEQLSNSENYFQPWRLRLPSLHLVSRMKKNNRKSIVLPDTWFGHFSIYFFHRNEIFKVMLLLHFYLKYLFCCSLQQPGHVRIHRRSGAFLAGSCGADCVRICVAEHPSKHRRLLQQGFGNCTERSSSISSEILKSNSKGRSWDNSSRGQQGQQRRQHQLS